LAARGALSVVIDPQTVEVGRFEEPTTPRFEHRH
jgi:hypothetical protein